MNNIPKGKKLVEAQILRKKGDVYERGSTFGCNFGSSFNVVQKPESCRRLNGVFMVFSWVVGALKGFKFEVLFNLTKKQEKKLCEVFAEE